MRSEQPPCHKCGRDAGDHDALFLFWHDQPEFACERYVEPPTPRPEDTHWPEPANEMGRPSRGEVCGNCGHIHSGFCVPAATASRGEIPTLVDAATSVVREWEKDHTVESMDALITAICNHSPAVEQAPSMVCPICEGKPLPQPDDQCPACQGEGRITTETFERIWDSHQTAWHELEPHEVTCGEHDYFGYAPCMDCEAEVVEQAKPVVWTDPKTMKRLEKREVGIRNIYVVSQPSAGWDVPLFTHPLHEPQATATDDPVIEGYNWAQVGARLRIARVEQGVSLRVLAARVGITVVQLVAIERGVRGPPATDEGGVGR